MHGAPRVTLDEYQQLAMRRLHGRGSVFPTDS